jgi:hypothetical protein
MARRRWQVDLPDEFKPQHLFTLIQELQDGSNKTLVLMLDEIDQLLDWDEHHSIDTVSEAFFRACRTISQEGAAQFVFSGERTFAGKLWDPHSPHWNFCRELPLRQLDQQSTQQLVMDPLGALRIAIHDEERFKERVWTLTSGHPFIAQVLGDRLVRRLNDREPDKRGTLTLSDLEEISESIDYRDRYLSTYKGQATETEWFVGLLVIDGNNTLPALIEALHVNDLYISEKEVTDALRILELYGILQQHGAEYRLCAEWFDEALTSFGGLERVLTSARRSMA